MATIEFPGKKEVYEALPNLVIPELNLDQKRSTSGDPSKNDNLIIHGDNLLALLALQNRYNNKIKCIYIDPPYNTGNKNWVFNDDATSEPLQQWLELILGSEYQEIDRHDRWLCMMLPRLLAIKELLTDDGVIMISIDDIELANLRLLMNEVFGEDNFIANLVWNSPEARDLKTAKENSNEHEYVLIYAKDKTNPNVFSNSKDIATDELQRGWPFNTEQPTVIGAGIYTSDGMREVEEIFGKRKFDFPKPSALIMYLLKYFTDKDSIVLDSFAGTGTTAQATLNLNRQDGGHRKYILIELEDYANDITAERIRRVSSASEVFSYAELSDNRYR